MTPVEERAKRLLESIPAISRYKWSSSGSETFSVENPATGEIITHIEAGSTQTATAAIEASQEAFETVWSLRTRQERCALLLEAANELEKHGSDLALLLCLENGKPYKDAFFDVAVLVQTFRYFGSVADKLPSEFFDQGSFYSSTVYEPHGVCVGILPFNWPPVHVGGKTAPCLAAGNTMILKPGEQAPLTVMRIVDILATVLPENVVQAVPGIGPQVPETLIKHPLVKMISLTGSTETGIKANVAAAATLTATALELGGKNAFVVFEDADVEKVLRDSVDGAYFNKGEACTASSILWIHEKIYPEFVKRLALVVEKLRTGDGLGDGTHVGPVVSRQRQGKILASIAQAQAEGATLAAQGTLPSDARLKNGFYVPPTLFTDVKPEMMLAQEEVFGPVAAIGSFSSEGEIVRQLNASKYGLFAGVYSADFTRAMRVARRLEVGVVLINNYFRGLLGTPFGGVKGSGHGREHWLGTLREWSRVKNIRFPSGFGEAPTWRGVKDVFSELTESDTKNGTS